MVNPGKYKGRMGELGIRKLYVESRKLEIILIGLVRKF